jgi:hypothetical protein
MSEIFFADLLDDILSLNFWVNLIVEYLAWGFLLLLLLIPLILWRSVKLTKAILKYNRNTLGNGFGKHKADILVEIWLAERPVSVNQRKTYYCGKSSGEKAHKMMANDLLEWGLIEIKDGKFYPIKTRKNRLVITFIIFYLIRFTGDNPDEYSRAKRSFKILVK